jgi:hypothetical protein
LLGIAVEVHVESGGIGDVDDVVLRMSGSGSGRERKGREGKGRVGQDDGV